MGPRKPEHILLIDAKDAPGLSPARHIPELSVTGLCYHTLQANTKYLTPVGQKIPCTVRIVKQKTNLEILLA
jgi:hypothetical protein